MVQHNAHGSSHFAAPIPDPGPGRRLRPARRQLPFARHDHDAGHSLAHPGTLIAAVFTPWIALGHRAADRLLRQLSHRALLGRSHFVLPATAFGNVIVALLSRFWLHETISLERWAGIVLITLGVGFVAQGPSLTEARAPEIARVAIQKKRVETRRSSRDDDCLPRSAQILACAAAMIAAVVLASTAGEVLTAAAMKSIGDLDVIRAHSGLKGAIRAVSPARCSLPEFLSGAGVFLAALRAESPEPEPGRARPRPRSRWSPTPSPAKSSSRKMWTAAAGPPPCWSASACICWRTEKLQRTALWRCRVHCRRITGKTNRIRPRGFRSDSRFSAARRWRRIPPPPPRCPLRAALSIVEGQPV
jgi:hypothetical protein